MHSSSTTIVSKCTVYPQQKSTLKSLKLTASDLPLLSIHYIQKGVLLPAPPYSFEDLIVSLKHSLSLTLSHFPPLAGRLITDADGYVHILCNDAGVDLICAKAKHVTINSICSPTLGNVPSCVKDFFAYDHPICYSGHYNPLVAIQVTDLADGVFIGATVNHAATDGTTFWHFFNTFSEISKGVDKISNLPNFTRDTAFNTSVVLRIPSGGPKITFSADEPLRERVFHFSREAIQKLKRRANGGAEEISSFQSLCAQLWRSVTRARKLDPSKTSTFRMPVSCRHRLQPEMDPYYFGTAVQYMPTVAQVGDILSNDLYWCAQLLHKNVAAQDDAAVRRNIENWEKAPTLNRLGNFDGTSVLVGSSPRLPTYENDFGWGRPLAVRSGMANKFDGKISAYPGREGNGSIDLEIALVPETMAGLENDMEFMQYVTPVVKNNSVK